MAMELVYGVFMGLSLSIMFAVLAGVSAGKPEKEGAYPSVGEGGEESIEGVENSHGGYQGYIDLIGDLERGTVAINSGATEARASLEGALLELREYAVLLAGDPAGRRTQRMAEFALAREALARGDEGVARAAIDRVVKGLELDGELEAFEAARLGPRLSELFELRRQALRASERARLEVDCIDRCRIFVDEREVDADLAGGPGVSLPLGEHRVWIEVAELDPQRMKIELTRAGARERIEIAAPPPPPPAMDGSQVDEAAGGQRGRGERAPVMPRWAEIGLVSVGVMGAGAGAALLAIDSTCPGGADEGDFDTCPQLYDTKWPGVGVLSVGATALVIGVVTLAVDERRRRSERAGPAHPLALRPGPSIGGLGGSL
ncbi:hypothetical protein G6O69_23190 [Pseudenhygromyxa sp. WMMC2535]|uniref:hypothetical protein n=1 Tax=Pseudenhygromyxa sp. WMMC2535 TaxID=2712867 RepID=UPI001556E740|nr:hypothetical protein [Pseudenhygromyxa sp. WMMC2535]NVB40764.1 hypothetical protein [Pseudenhygromyxa sp. WMMC2535]